MKKFFPDAQAGGGDDQQQGRILLWLPPQALSLIVNQSFSFLVLNSLPCISELTSSYLHFYLMRAASKLFETLSNKCEDQRFADS